MPQQTEVFLAVFLVLSTFEVPILFLLINKLFTKEEANVLFKMWSYLPSLIFGKPLSKFGTHFLFMRFIPFGWSKKITNFYVKRLILQIVIGILLLLNWFIASKLSYYF